MPRIFISYRRSDSQTITDRIHDRMAQAFGAENVFQDVLNVKYGVDFRKVLETQVSTSNVLLVIIGRTWLAIADTPEEDDQQTAQPRLFNPDDFVRIEVGTGLRNDHTLTIPVLVDGANAPEASKLPNDLKPLAFRNAISVRNNPFFDEDIARLIERIKEVDVKQKSTVRQRWLLVGIAIITTLLLMGIQSAINNRNANALPDVAKTPSPLPGIELPPRPVVTEEMMPSVFRNADWQAAGKIDASGVEMVFVPAGCFAMGSGEDSTEQICLDSFWIDRYEVSNSEYRQCVDAGVCTDLKSNPVFDDPLYDDYPAEFVTWFQAETYAEWRGGRLPTEAEWEYAARGPDGLAYPWGNAFNPSLLNYCDKLCAFDWRDELGYDGNATLAHKYAFAELTTSWVGAVNMSGNAWEWTGSLYSEYSHEPCRGFDNDENFATARVLRGGVWFSNQEDTRVFCRFPGDPSSEQEGRGFRIMMPF